LWAEWPAGRGDEDAMDEGELYVVVEEE